MCQHMISGNVEKKEKTDPASLDYSGIFYGLTD
jgi:hypothetical protein